MASNDSSGEAIQRPPTEIGATFAISDLGTTDGGTAISPIKRAFEGCWEEKALVVEDAHGLDNAYSFEGSSPIYCCHVPDDAHDPEEHGPQTVGFRYQYQFMTDIEADNQIRVVAWDDTRFPNVAEVVYP